MGVIYKLSFPSGKSYIGQTRKSFHARWKQHCQRDNKSWYLAKAIKKYGADSVRKEVLVEVPDAFLDDYERKFIALFSTVRPLGYNLTPGGDANPMDSSEVREKQLRVVNTSEHKDSQRTKALAWRADPSRTELWKAANAASVRSVERRNKAAVATKRTWDDPEIRKRRTEGLKQAFADPAVEAKRIDAMRLAFQRPETKLKMQKAAVERAAAKTAEQRRQDALANWAGRSEISKTKHRNNTKARLADPEVKLKHKEAIAAAMKKLSPEALSIRAQKSWATRRKKAALKLHAPDLPQEGSCNTPDCV